MKLLKTIFIVSIVNFFIILGIALKLPNIVPIHVNHLGEIDGYGTKWLMPCFALLPILLAFMSIRFKKQEEKGVIRKNQKAERVIYPLLSAFFIPLSWLTVSIGIAQGKTIDFPFELLVGIPLGGLMMALGNYMGVIRQNRYLGIRTPWTLKNEEVWQRTHRKGGYWSVIGGIVIIISALISYFTGLIAVFMGGIIVSLLLLVALPFVYSYVLYRKLTK